MIQEEEKESTFGEIMGWLGLTVSMYFFISPIVPYMKLMREKISYSDTPGVLLICSFMNCILWAAYGIRKEKQQVYLANSLGGSITLIWIVIFLIFYGKKIIWISGFYCLFLIGVVSGINLLCFYIIPNDYVGYSAMVFNILMYAAPGEKMMRVFKTGNYELIPIFSNVGALVNSILWLTYGIYLHDPAIIVPNALGVVFGVLNSAVYLCFCCKSKGTEENKMKVEKEGSGQNDGETV